MNGHTLARRSREPATAAPDVIPVLASRAPSEADALATVGNAALARSPHASTPGTYAADIQIGLGNAAVAQAAAPSLPLQQSEPCDGLARIASLLERLIGRTQKRDLLTEGVLPQAGADSGLPLEAEVCDEASRIEVGGELGISEPYGETTASEAEGGAAPGAPAEAETMAESAPAGPLEAGVLVTTEAAPSAAAEVTASAEVGEEPTEAAEPETPVEVEGAAEAADIEVEAEDGPEIAATTVDAQAWRAEVTEAASAIPQPQLGAAAQGAQQVRQGGSAMRATRAPGVRRIPAEARAAVSPTPTVEDPPPIENEPEPLREAMGLVEAKSNRRLPDQRMPELIASSRGTLPRLGDRPLPPDAPAPAREERAEPAAGPDPDQLHAQQAREAAEEPAPDTPRQAQTDALTLVDIEPEPSPPLPAAAKTVVASVIARLLASPESEARRILVDARKSAYPNEQLQLTYPDIGGAELPGLTESLASELREVAAEAGIARDQLDAAVAERNSTLQQERARAGGEVASASVDEQAALERSGTDENEAVAGAREQVDQHTEAQLAAARGESDPAVVNARRDRWRGRVDRTIGQQRVAYVQAKDRRIADIDRVMNAQILAYQAAAQRDERAIRDAHVGEDPLPVSVTLEMTAARDWAGARERELRRKVFAMKREAEGWAEHYANELADSGQQAHERIETWTEQQLGVKRSWWDELLATFMSWFVQAQAETETWETARAGETRDAILGDFVMLSQISRSAGGSIDVSSEQALAGLSEEQRAVVQAYYSSGPEARNPIAAVAAGLQVRLSLQRRPQLLERFRNELKSKPDSEWQHLAELGKTESESDFDAAHLSDELHAAMFGGVTGWGTEEDRLFAALANLRPTQALALRKCYRFDHGSNLDEDIASELSGAELTRAEALISGDQTLADVATLHEAITGWGTDEDVVMRVLRGKSEEERQRIIEQYRLKYHVDLAGELDDELSDHDLDRANALLEGDTARADAIAIDDAMRGGWTGWGTEESAISDVYTQIREEVAAQAASARPPWTTAQMEAEIRRRNLSVESSYGARYGGDWEPGEESALRQAYASELSGPDLDLASALADNDLVAADAARIAIESQAVWVTDDEAVNAVLRRQYERALEELRRDRWPAIQREIDGRARTEQWNRFQRADAERVALRTLEQEAREMASRNMSDLESRYNSRYTTWYGGGLRSVIELNMTGDDREHARLLLEQSGYLTPAQELHYAVTGAGTDEAAITRVLAGRSAEEIRQIQMEWLRLHPGEFLDDRLKDELGGRDEFETRMLLQGEPRNARQELAQARERVRWEFENSSGFVAREQGAILHNRLQRMEADYFLLNDPNASRRDRDLAALRFRQGSGNVRSAIGAYREQTDAATDALATAAAVAAAIVVVVVAAVLTPFTGGGSAAAGAGILAALGGALTSGTVAAAAAVAAATATIVTKQAMLGDAYSGEDMALDVVVGAVDAVAAYATAGIGAGLLKAARGGPLARMAAPSSSRLARVAAHGVAEGAEGLLGSLPAAITGNLARDENWEHGNPLANILGGIALEAGIGTVVSGAMGSTAGLRQVPTPDARPSGDLLAHRGTPRERLGEWRAYRAEHPDADMRTWLREFDEGVAQRLARGEAADQVQRRLRGELLSGIPPSERRQFAGTTVEVLSDADFTRLTRSQRGQAVVLVERGRPRVLLREGADPRVLREEGIHLLQSVDPRVRRSVRVLDERRLSQWDEFDIGEQFRLYRNKLELEIDAQRRLLSGLDREVVEAGEDAAARRLIAEQIENARTSLDNISRRLDEVDSVTRRDRVSMSRGDLERPQYLDQPARLFAKPETPRPVRGRTPATERAQVEAVAAPPRRGQLGGEQRVGAEAPEPPAPARGREAEIEGTPEGIPTSRGELEGGTAAAPPRTADDLRARRSSAQEELADAERDVQARQDRADILEDVRLQWDEYRADPKFKAFRDLPGRPGRHNFPRLLEDELARLRAELPELHNRMRNLRQTIGDINADLDRRADFRPGAEADYADLEFGRLGAARTAICFPSGTPVHTIGGVKPIETLRIGELVYTRDAATGAIVPQPVLAVLRNWAHVLVDIRVGSESIRATRGHRFATEHGSWEEARLLHAGVRLQTITGVLQAIEGTVTAAASVATFNLEVAEHHNYFVGTNGILVHNGDPASPAVSAWARSDRFQSRIYVIVDESQQVIIDGVARPRVIYVGKTFQGEARGVQTRFHWHLANKPHWRARDLTPMPVGEYLGLSRVIEGNWSPFECAVWEQHFIEFFGGKGGRPNAFQAQLENIINVITEDQFRAFRDGYGHNPCR